MYLEREKMDCSLDGRWCVYALPGTGYFIRQNHNRLFLRKLLDETLTDVKNGKSAQPWVEIRYAEVLLNKAEAAYPSLTNTESKNYANSDFWLEDASFVKLKNVSISYRIPRRVAKFASIQLSVSAQDLFTITRYKGMDPEVYTSYDGLDYGASPIQRTIIWRKSDFNH